MVIARSMLPPGRGVWHTRPPSGRARPRSAGSGRGPLAVLIGPAQEPVGSGLAPWLSPAIPPAAPPRRLALPPSTLGDAAPGLGFPSPRGRRAVGAPALNSADTLGGVTSAHRLRAGDQARSAGEWLRPGNGFPPSAAGYEALAAGYGAGAAASTWMRAVDALSGDGADRGAGLTSRRTMPERSSCQQRAAPRAHSGALMDRVGFRLVPGA